MAIHNFNTLFDGIWTAIITLSSTGYGLKVAQSFWGRIFTFIIIFFGIGLVSYLSGVFASLFVDRNSKARRGLMDFPKIKGPYCYLWLVKKNERNFIVYN